MEINNNSDVKEHRSTSPLSSSWHRRYLIIIAVLLITLVAISGYLFRVKNQSVNKPSPEVMLDKSTSKESTSTHAEHSENEHHNEQTQQGAIVVTSEMAQLIGLKSEIAAKGDIEDTITTTGRVLVAPDQQAIIGAKVDGRTLHVLVEPGQQVKTGQALIIIDSPHIADLRGQLIESQARLKLAEQKRNFTIKSENRAAVIQAKNRLDLTLATFERKKRLASLGAVAGRDVAEAETEYKNAQAEYDYQATIQIAREQQEAESEVEQARANVARLKYSLTALGANSESEGGTLTLTAPINGIVVAQHITVGEAITSDKELMTVMNTANVIIEALLPESQAQHIQAGQHLVARIPGTKDGYVEGKVQSIATIVDAEKRTIAVRAKVANPHFQLRHEMTIDVSIAVGGRKEALLIPVTALVEEEGLKVVYVKEHDRYERRPVTVGLITYQQVEILSGIEAGEEVVVAGAYQLANMGKSGGEEGEHHDD